MFSHKQMRVICDGMNKFKENRKRGLCPFCELPVDKMQFRDELSRKEFRISGLCQACQDRTFVKI